MKRKSKKIIVGIFLLVLVVIMAIYIVVNNMPEKEYEDVYLDSMEFTKDFERVSEEYVDNGMSAVDENNRKINISEHISEEKFILDNKVGMYDFSIVSDFEDSKLTFIVKNHTKEKIEGFNYKLEFLNIDGTVIGTVDLESKEIPELSKYRITVNVGTDITDVYEIIPVIDEEGNEETGDEYLEIE